MMPSRKWKDNHRMKKKYLWVISDKGQVSRICKELLQLNNITKRANNPINRDKMVLFLWRTMTRQKHEQTVRWRITTRYMKNMCNLTNTQRNINTILRFFSCLSSWQILHWLGYEGKGNLMPLGTAAGSTLSGSNWKYIVLKNTCIIILEL